MDQVSITHLDSKLGTSKNCWVETCIKLGIVFSIFLSSSITMTMITWTSIEGLLKPVEMGIAVVLSLLDRMFWMITAVFGLAFFRTLCRLKTLLLMDKQKDADNAPLTPSILVKHYSP